MSKRMICIALAAVLCAAVLLPGLPRTRALDPEPDTQTYIVDEDLIAGVEFTTAPVFSLSGGASLSAGYDFVSYYNGSCSYLYDQNGSAISATQFQYAWAISDRLFLANPVGTDKFALYRDRAPLTNAIYTDYEIQCGCVIAKRDDGGRDFFDLDGNPRTVGTLPSGYEARFVTPVGTVVARIRNTAISSSEGDLFYNYVLLNRSGQVLMQADFAGRNERDQITAEFMENELQSNGALYDCYGHLICRAHCLTLNENRYIGKTQNSAIDAPTYWLYDRAGNVVCELDADGIDSACGEVFVFVKNGRYGIADQNGSVLVPASYLRCCKRAQANCYQEPKLRRIVLKDEEGYSIFDDHGNFVKKLTGYTGVGLYYDSVSVGKSDGGQDVYDLDGNLLKEYQKGEIIKYVNGVRFMGTRYGNSWYAIDLAGNRLSEMNFSQVGDNGVFGLFGIATVYQNGWYFINAAGELLNAQKMDEAPMLVEPQLNVRHSNPEKLLGVYVQNGNAGICRYVPPFGSCEKSSNGKHEWRMEKLVTPATCVEGGYAVYRCAACGRTKSMNTPVDPNGHAWTLTETLTAPEEGEVHSGTALYTCSRCGETKEDRLCAGEIFTDMPAEDHWAHKPIDWAYFNNITSGTTKTTFSPDMTITRAQAVTFLWAVAGKPEPENPENPFTDVPDDGWYTKSVLWAVESGVTKGLTADTFGPFETCTRAQIVTFLWAAAGKPEPETTENPFTDVPDDSWFIKPVLWAVENGVTKGLSADSFGPYASCTRAQVVTFLYKGSQIEK